MRDEPSTANGAFTAQEVAARPEDWERVISTTYYGQRVHAAAGAFAGRLSVVNLGPLSLSRINSTAVTYRRHASQITRRSEIHHLVTIPLAGDLFFEQAETWSHCPPNCFLTERGDLPYALRQPGTNELLVLKLPESLLDLHLARNSAFSGHAIGGPSGSAGLFVDYARSIMAHGMLLSPSQREIGGRHLMELFLSALSDMRLDLPPEMAVRDRHLRRIKSAIRRELGDPDMTPSSIAGICGLSLRYVQRLFAETGTSLGRWIVEQRLVECDGRLRDPVNHESLTRIAQRFGFFDQSHFTRSYKRGFGCTPGETRRRARRAEPRT
jgi:AraC-like DNA-binding protein